MGQNNQDLGRESRRNRAQHCGALRLRRRDRRERQLHLVGLVHRHEPIADLGLQHRQVFGGDLVLDGEGESGLEDSLLNLLDLVL